MNRIKSLLSKNKLLKNTGTTAMLSGVGVVTGFGLDALILSIFGVGYQTDALFAALTIPLLVNGVFSIQCPKVLVPAFAEYFSRSEDANAWKLLSNLLTTFFVVLAGIAMLGMALSGLLMPIQIPGLEARTMVLAATLSRILFVMVASQGLVSILQSVLFSRHSYVVPSSAKLVGNIVTITVLLLSRGRFGVQAVAVGMVLGSVTQAVVMLVALFGHGFRYRYILQPTESKVLEILKSFRHPMLGHVLGESGTILQNILGSFLGPGNITVMRYASRIVQAVAGILLGSVVQVTLPVIARHAALKDLKAQRSALLESVQLLCIVGLPICIWLALTALPLVVLLFERGQFSRADAVMTGLIIRLLVPDIILGRMVSVTQTLFYSNMDTRTPLISTVIFTSANTVLAIVLVRTMGLLGLPIAVSLASLSNALYMMSMLQRKFGPIGWDRLRSFGIRLAATCLIGGIGLAVGAKMSALLTFSYSVGKLADLAVPTAFGVGAFLAGAYVFKLAKGQLRIPAASEPS